MTSRTGSTLSTLRVRSRGGSDPVAPNTDSTAGWWRWRSANKPTYKSVAANSSPITTAMRPRIPDDAPDLRSRNSTTGALADAPASRSAIGGTPCECSLPLSPAAMDGAYLSPFITAIDAHSSHAGHQEPATRSASSSHSSGRSGRFGIPVMTVSAARWADDPAMCPDSASTNLTGPR